MEHMYMCHKLKCANRIGFHVWVLFQEDYSRKLSSKMFTSASISKTFQKFLWSSKFERLSIYTR